MEMRTFVELVERYEDPEFCPYPEYKGKPYYSIKYIENGEEYVGYSTYSLRVISEFLKKYFISSALEKQEQVNTQSVNLTHTTYPNALESLNILESAKDENGYVPMSLVRLAFRNVLEQDRWIPVTERLPEDEYVLISKKPTKISGSKWSVGIAIRTADPRSGKIQWRDSGFGVIQDDKVLAWRPLPAPYQEDEE